jgi:trimeric autotransporter adhesin
VSGKIFPFPTWCEIMIWFNRIGIVLTCVALGLAGCSGGGFPPRTSASSDEISVSPVAAIVAAGSDTTFTAIFTPIPSAQGSLTWSVNPANGGTITATGVYTATATPGDYSVVATWTPANLAAGGIFSASATVLVLQVPQLR